MPSKGSRALVEEAQAQPETCSVLLAEAKQALTQATPATLPEMAVLLHRLGLHYPERRLSEREHQLVTEDWLRDLQGLPADLIALAFTRWRSGPKCAFFPKAGEVLALVDRERRTRIQLAERARFILHALSNGGTT
ncbi:MAG: hypothetical protein QM645_14085 [Asticcacaulis sp.]